MLWERLARLCVGVGTLWVGVVVTIGLLGGLDRPGTWMRLLDGVMHSGIREALYLGLTWGVVPIGMLVVIADILGDPVPLWTKAAVPGAMAAVFALFLAAAMPDVGTGLLTMADPIALMAVSPEMLGRGLDAPGGWLIRFGALLALLVGVPGILAATASLLAGGDGRPRRRP